MLCPNIRLIRKQNSHTHSSWHIPRRFWAKAPWIQKRNNKEKNCTCSQMPPLNSHAPNVQSKCLGVALGLYLDQPLSVQKRYNQKLFSGGGQARTAKQGKQGWCFSHNRLAIHEQGTWKRCWFVLHQLEWRKQVQDTQHKRSWTFSFSFLGQAERHK